MCDQCPLDPPEIPSPEAALSVLDTSLLIARVQAKCSLMEARRWWGTVGQYALYWRLTGALHPGLSEDDVLAIAHRMIRDRFVSDWTADEVSEVIAGLLAGYAQRVVLTAPR